VKSDKLFSEDLANSQPAVLVVAEWMRQRMPPEVEVKVPEIVERPTYEERGDYLDDGGFFVIDKDGRRRGEVKRRGFNFTGPDDFGDHGKVYDSAIIDEVRKVDRQGRAPLLGYFLVSNDLRCFAYVPGHTQGTWDTQEFIDTRSGGDRVINYVYPVNRLAFRHVTEETIKAALGGDA